MEWQRDTRLAKAEFRRNQTLMGEGLRAQTREMKAQLRADRDRLRDDTRARREDMRVRREEARERARGWIDAQ